MSATPFMDQLEAIAERRIGMGESPEAAWEQAGVEYYDSLSEPEECTGCEGTGEVPHPDDPVSYPCTECGGSGWLYLDNPKGERK